MGDIKQLTRRPRQPDRQQLLQGALGGGRGQLLRGTGVHGGAALRRTSHFKISHPPVISDMKGLISSGLRLLGRARRVHQQVVRQRQSSEAEGSCCCRGALASAAAEGSTGRCELWIKEEEVENVEQLLWAPGFSDPGLNLSVSIP